LGDSTNRLAGYRVQVGVFKVRGYAEQLVERLRTRAYHATVVNAATGPPYRVWIDGALNRLNAERLVSRLRRDRFDAVAVKTDAAVF
jgi:cell division septation protein DedD